MDSDSKDPDQDSGTGAFSQDDIDALLRGDAGADDSPAPAEPSPSTPAGDEAPADDVGFSQADIDALMNAAGDSDEAAPAAPAAEAAESEPASDAAAAEPDTRLDSLGRPFDEAAAAMQAAIEEEKAEAEAAAAAAAAAAPPAPPVPAAPPPPTTPFDFPDLGEPGKFGIDPKRVSMLNDVKLRVKIQLGRTRMLVEDVLKLDEGSVVELDKLAGDPVDVFVNDRLVARGEVLVLNDTFCVRVSEVLSHDPHRVIA